MPLLNLVIPEMQMTQGIDWMEKMWMEDASLLSLQGGYPAILETIWVEGLHQEQVAALTVAWMATGLEIAPQVTGRTNVIAVEKEVTSRGTVRTVRKSLAAHQLDVAEAGVGAGVTAVVGATAARGHQHQRKGSVASIGTMFPEALG